MENRRGYFYILTNKRKSVFYSGSTQDLLTRVNAHRKGHQNGFTKKYNIRELVCYEIFDSIREARDREREIKGWKRSRKLEFIESKNKEYQDLYDKLLSDPSALRASG